MRRFCSPACERLWYRNDGKVPTGYNCANCAEWVDLARPGKRKRSDSKLCDDCKPWHPRSSATKPRDLAERDGPQCRLCGDEVDLDLTYPDRMCPSIDHVVPRSAGGSDEPQNLQLAHWICNVRRRDTPIRR